jgi:hypothetical protein
MDVVVEVMRGCRSEELRGEVEIGMEELLWSGVWRGSHLEGGNVTGLFMPKPHSSRIYQL